MLLALQLLLVLHLLLPPDRLPRLPRPRPRLLLLVLRRPPPCPPLLLLLLLSPALLLQLLLNQQLLLLLSSMLLPRLLRTTLRPPRKPPLLRHPPQTPWRSLGAPSTSVAHSGRQHRGDSGTEAKPSGR